MTTRRTSGWFCNWLNLAFKAIRVDPGSANRTKKRPTDVTPRTVRLFRAKYALFAASETPALNVIEALTRNASSPFASTTTFVASSAGNVVSKRGHPPGVMSWDSTVNVARALRAGELSRSTRVFEVVESFGDTTPDAPTSQTHDPERRLSEFCGTRSVVGSPAGSSIRRPDGARTAVPGDCIEYPLRLSSRMGMFAFRFPLPFLVAAPPGITTKPAVQAARSGNVTLIPDEPTKVKVMLRQVESVGTGGASAGRCVPIVTGSPGSVDAHDALHSTPARLTKRSVVIADLPGGLVGDRPISVPLQWACRI